jgi:transposase-like protein
MSTSAKNKRERIIELISNGNDNAQEIAQIVGTTPANVWKEKSKLRRSGLLLGRRTVELSKKTKDEMLILSVDDRQKSDTNHYQHLNIPALDMEGMKKLYTDFKMGKKPIDIIAKHGFHPDVVEKEYRRFLNFNERDMNSLQKTYISSIIKYRIQMQNHYSKSIRLMAILQTMSLSNS